MTDAIRKAAEARAGNAAPRSASTIGAARSVAFPAQQLRAKLVERDGREYYRLDGHATVFERAYEMWDMFGPYNEVVSAGAFDATLAREGLDVPLVLGHDQLRRIARTTNGTLDLSVDEDGLAVLARLDAADVDVAYIAPKLRAGLIDEMSFAFRIESGIWSPDYTEYRIDRVDIHRGDVAIVGWGANPNTDGGLRAAPATASRARALLELSIAR